MLYVYIVIESRVEYSIFMTIVKNEFYSVEYLVLNMRNAYTVKK